MVLYAADISKLAVPVSKSVQDVEKPKRKLSKKQLENLEKGREIKRQKSESVAVDTPVPPTEPEPEKTKQKKRVRKEKQNVEPPKEPEPEPVPEPEIEKPKPVKTRKPRQPKVLIETPPASEPEVVVEEKVEKKERKKRVPRDPSVPPVWFEKYIQGVKKEEALAKQEKVPAKQVIKEAQEVAQKSWDNGLTRDRVSNEVDQHLNRLYSMVFNKR